MKKNSHILPLVWLLVFACLGYTGCDEGAHPKEDFTGDDSESDTGSDTVFDTGTFTEADTMTGTGPATHTDSDADTVSDSDTGITTDTDSENELGEPIRICENEPPDPIYCGPQCTAVANNGPPDNRVSLIIIGDGFTHEELSTHYAPHVDGLVAYMFENVENSQPYVRYHRFINFYRIDLPSPQSGCDRPADSYWVDTPLDCENTCTDWRAGMCQVNWDKTHDAFDNAIEGSDVNRIDWRLITLNIQTSCGMAHYARRGTLAVYCPYQRASFDIALHEGGHGFHGLADTYWTINDTFPGNEPTAVNLTTDFTGSKWQHWLGYDDPILGPIGAYEGGGQYARGIYRPSYNQKMGSAEYCHNPGPPHCPHDAVSREKIIFDIYSIVQPLDGWSDNSHTLHNPDELWVDVVDCDVVTVDWYVDDVLVAQDFGERFQPRLHGLGPGVYNIEARAHDTTDMVRLDRTPLQQSINWTIELSQ